MKQLNSKRHSGKSNIILTVLPTKVGIPALWKRHIGMGYPVGAGYDDKERVALAELDYEITNTK